MPSLLIRTIAISLSFILAFATYRLIEQPLRFGSHLRLKTISLLGASAVLFILGLFTVYTNGLPQRFPEVVQISKAASEWAYPGTMTKSKLYGTEVYRKNSN